MKGMIIMSKALIGVVPLVDEERESLWMLPGYMKGIEEEGGIPVMLPLTSNREIISQLTDSFHGFLFTGGHDVSPEIYGEQKIKECGAICSERDKMEKILLKEVLKRDKAILGICRGIQFINGALGGSLYQDLPLQHPSNIEHHQSPPYNKPIHNVNLVESSPLYYLLKEKQIAVNSYHHQAVKNLAKGLSPMAYSEDGLIEAVYMPEKKFVWAVQWHPEFSYETDKNSGRILKKFVEMCALDKV